MATQTMHDQVIELAALVRHFHDPNTRPTLETVTAAVQAARDSYMHFFDVVCKYDLAYGANSMEFRPLTTYLAETTYEAFNTRTRTEASAQR